MSSDPHAKLHEQKEDFEADKLTGGLKINYIKEHDDYFELMDLLMKTEEKKIPVLNFQECFLSIGGDDEDVSEAISNLRVDSESLADSESLELMEQVFEADTVQTMTKIGGASPHGRYVPPPLRDD